MKISNLNSDVTVLRELGKRVETVRLDRNITQARLAAEGGVSRSVVWQLESGRSVSLSSFVRILRALDLLENLNDWLPERLPSPIERLKSEGRQRPTRIISADGQQNAAASGTWSWTTGGTT